MLVVAAGETLGSIVKDLVQQPRPCHAAPAQVRLAPGVECRKPLAGMPSNHALKLLYFAAAAFLGLVLRHWALAATLLALAERPRNAVRGAHCK